jgi:uncharacterized protein
VSAVLSKGEISRRLFDSVCERGKAAVIEDVHIGLGYVGVMLNDGRMGLAAVLLHDLPAGCSVFPDAGRLAGSNASTLLANLTEGRDPLRKALGLAAANAILHTEFGEDEKDSLSIMKLTPEDHVAMIGLFTPMVPKIEKTGAKLTVIERNPARLPVLDKEDSDRILKECTVAIITATTLLNDTLEEVLNGLGNPRHVAILGPSTPLLPEIFQGTPVHHIGGVIVRDAGKCMQIISEGGGTPAMRPYLRFVNLLVKSCSHPDI